LGGCEELVRLGLLLGFTKKRRRGKLELGLEPKDWNQSQNFQQKPTLVTIHDLGFTIKIVFFLLLALCFVVGVVFFTLFLI
jgi:hypothetical protein